MLDSTIPPKLRSVIDRELDSGERVVWSGMPRAVCFTLASTGAFIFGIPWTAFALFWMGAAAAGTMNAEEDIGLMTFFPLFGLPFVLVGFGLLSAPLWAYRKGLNTAFVLTDRRAILFEGGWSMTVRSFDPEDLGNTTRRENRDGTGDVIFSSETWRDSDGDRHRMEIGFMRIQNARDVEKELKRLADSAE